MFEYFEGNYTWNMAVNMALALGASIGDIDDASRGLRSLARQNDDESAEKFFTSWTSIAEKERRLAQADEARGRGLSAGDKYRRAAIYYVQAGLRRVPGVLSEIHRTN